MTIQQTATPPHAHMGWTARLSHALAVLGGPGIFLLAFLDSSVLSFPVITDLLIMQQSMRNPVRMPYYAAMATVGSLAGCIWLYLLAKKGGEAYLSRQKKKSSGKFRRWMDRNAFACIFAASVLPPPMPFKPFVLIAGATQVRIRTFSLGILAGRGARYLFEGWLAIQFGLAATNFLLAHKLTFALGMILSVAILGIAMHFLSRGKKAA